MIERCRDKLWNKHCPGIRRTDEDDQFYIDTIIEIIKAMREPTEKMIAAALHDYMYREKNKQSWNGTAMYKAMIDAIVGDK